MLPGFILMLGLSILYVEAEPGRAPRQLFYGLTAAVGALVARALVRLSARPSSPTFRWRPSPSSASSLTYFVSVSFVLVLLGGGLAYELWTNGGPLAAPGALDLTGSAGPDPR